MKLSKGPIRERRTENIDRMPTESSLRTRPGSLGSKSLGGRNQWGRQRPSVGSYLAASEPCLPVAHVWVNFWISKGWPEINIHSPERQDSPRRKANAAKRRGGVDTEERENLCCQRHSRVTMTHSRSSVKFEYASHENVTSHGCKAASRSSQGDEERLRSLLELPSRSSDTDLPRQNFHRM